MIPDTFKQAEHRVSRNITIIGGRGRMGRFFQDELTQAGHNVSTLQSKDWDRADQLLNQAELVIISVPIDLTPEIIQRAAQYLNPTAGLCDLTSIKALPVQAMLAHHSGPVMGLHPMFGPNVTSFLAQKVIFTPGRNEEYFQWFLEFMQRQGGETIFCTPEEHDRIMVVVQAIRHFSDFGLGVYLAGEKIDIDRSLSMSTPAYRTEIDILNRLFAQSPDLCVDIMLASEERCQEVAALADTYTRLARMVAQKDRAGLIREFGIAQKFFTKETVSSSVVALQR